MSPGATARQPCSSKICSRPVARLDWVRSTGMLYRRNARSSMISATRREASRSTVYSQQLVGTREVKRRIMNSQDHYRLFGDKVERDTNSSITASLGLLRLKLFCSRHTH